jgi:hypothetical protein
VIDKKCSNCRFFSPNEVPAGAHASIGRCLKTGAGLQVFDTYFCFEWRSRDPAVAKETCHSCFFYGHIEGCKRYPDPVEKEPSDWCGEWRAGSQNVF